MKSILVLSDSTELPTFPILCKCTHRNFTVMFNDNNSGTVVHSEEDNIPVGKYLNSWYRYNNTAEWEVLPVGSTVTLKQ